MQTHHQLKQQLIEQTDGFHTAGLSLLGKILGLRDVQIFNVYYVNQFARERCRQMLL